MIPMIRKGRGPGMAKRLIAEIEQHKGKVNVISSEMFFRGFIADYFAANFPSELLKDTRVVVYLRRQDKYAEAMWKQRVKNGRFQGTPQEYVSEHKSLNFKSKLDRFSEVFGDNNIVVRPFERAQFPGGNVLRDFAALCEIPDELVGNFENPASNATLSKEVTEELGRLRRSEADINTRQVIRTLGRIRPEGAIRSGDCYALDERRALMARFAESNEAIKERYCPELPQLFDTTDLENPDAYPIVSAALRRQRVKQAKEAIERALSEMKRLAG
ncbi:hypothetical protein [Cognatishimia maritima]|nr:hypothetical protein [Cognatishimia maritima]